MAYEIKYDEETDVLTVVVAEKGKLSYAEEGAVKKGAVINLLSNSV